MWAGIPIKLRNVTENNIGFWFAFKVVFSLTSNSTFKFNFIYVDRCL